MSLWMKLAWALPVILMLVLVWPAARHWLQHGPRGSSDDWRAALLPLIGVIVFVALLVMIVRGL